MTFHWLRNTLLAAAALASFVPLKGQQADFNEVGRQSIFADADWEHRERTERDTAAITAWLTARSTSTVETR